MVISYVVKLVNGDEETVNAKWHKVSYTAITFYDKFANDEPSHFVAGYSLRNIISWKRIVV